MARNKSRTDDASDEYENTTGRPDAADVAVASYENSRPAAADDEPFGVHATTANDLLPAEPVQDTTPDPADAETKEN